jgi:SAM-dependent methyltransferase
MPHLPLSVPKSRAIEFAKRYELLRAWLDRVQLKRCTTILDRYIEHVVGGVILDIGAGTGHTTALLLERGFEAVAVDVVHASLFDDIPFVLYDGAGLPFANDCGDTAILQTVLHHVSEPDVPLSEAARVARRVILVEDVVRGRVHRWVTFVLDAVLNLEFRGHPHTNKTDEEWSSTFERLGLQLVARSETWWAMSIWQVTYVLDRKD